MDPTLSVALCTYEGEPYLEEMLGSLLRQTRPPDRVVVSDDGSTDATLETLEAFESAAPFAVEIHRNRRTLGPSANFDRAIRRCDGEAIALADQDDVWLEDKLEITLASLLEDPDRVLVFTDGYVVDENLDDLGLRLWEAVGFTRPRRRERWEEDRFRALLEWPIATGMTMMFRRELREAVLPIPTGWVHDRWIALVAAAVGEIQALDERTVLYRQHGKNAIGLPEGGGAGASPSWLRRIRAALRSKPGHYLSIAARYRHLADRLATLQEKRKTDLSTETRQAEEKARHYRARAAMPGSLIERVRPILEELRGRRYDRFSRGWPSALKDLLVGT